MAQRFSSQEEAWDQAIEQQRQEEPVRWPRGPRYNDFPEARRMMMRHAGMWIFRKADMVEGTAVVMHRPNPTTKEYTVLSQLGDKWYTDFPDPPYPLYQRDEWTKAETVYVC